MSQTKARAGVSGAGGVGAAAGGFDVSTIVTPGVDTGTASATPAVSGARSIQRRHRRTRAALVALDDAIVTAVRTEHPVTLRGVYYRAVSAGAVDKTEAGYRAVGRQLVKLRRAGVVPFAWITDGTRLMRKPPSWSGLDALLCEVGASYRQAVWEDQDAAVIVLSEKDAISGAVYPVTAEYDVELGITRGYTSETFVHSIATDAIENDADGRTTYLYQLGDHDPSGVDGWRDFTRKVREFAAGCDVVCERLAVTPGQIVEYDLPTRPTKQKDTRAAGFVGESVEVDAIPAPVLRQIVRDAIERLIDPDRLRVTKMIEQSERAGALAMANGWSG